MKKVISLLIAFIICFSTVLSTTVSSYAMGNNVPEYRINNNSDIRKLESETALNTLDDLLFESDNFYTVKNGKIKIKSKVVEKNAKAVAKKQLNNMNIKITNKKNKSSKKSIINRIAKSSAKEVVDEFQIIAKYYNNQIKKGELAVTKNGTLYSPDDTKSYVQGGNINKKIVKLGYWYHFWDNNKSKTKASKFAKTSKKALAFYENHRGEKLWEMPDDEYADLMTNMGDNMDTAGWVNYIVKLVPALTCTQCKAIGNRDKNVSAAISNYNKAGNYKGVVMRNNLAGSIRVASQNNKITSNNANKYISNLTFSKAYEIKW